MSHIVLLATVLCLKTVVCLERHTNEDDTINKPDKNIQELSIAVVLERLQILERRDIQYRKELDDVKTRMMAKETREAEHEREMQHMTERISKLEIENEKLEKANVRLVEMLNAHDAPRTASRKQNTRLLRQVQPSQTPGGQPLVAFYAQAVSRLSHLGPGQALIFDHVVTNYGNGYNPHVGDFVAPVDGIYVFSVSIMTPSANHSYVGFALNGNVVSTLLLNQNSWDNISQQIILELRKGDDFSIRNIISDSSYEGGHQTVFSGFLLGETGTTHSIVG